MKRKRFVEMARMYRYDSEVPFEDVFQELSVQFARGATAHQVANKMNEIAAGIIGSKDE